MKNIRTKQQGFTIIEVMIVLVIAAVILLIVFFAVPALQRNSRNTQRNSDASRIASLVNECLNNRNGVVTSCLTAGNINYSDAEMGQLKTAPDFENGGSSAPTFSDTQAGIWFGRTCADAGDVSEPSSNTRAVVVLFEVETDVNRCIAI